MTKTTKSGLPVGVTEQTNRPGLYRFRVMVRGKAYSEYYRATETGKKKLQSELQKAIDDFKNRVDCGQLKSGDISDKSTFAQAVEWFTGVHKLETRESTQRTDNYIFEHYLIPRLGNYKLKEITAPMVTKLLAELLDNRGGGRRVYAAKPGFIELMHEKKPSWTAGGFNLVARELGINISNFARQRRGGNCDKEIAEKIAKYFGVPLATAFEKKADIKSLSAAYVGRISSTLSALFTACVKNSILLQSPVTNATKPRIGEHDTPAYLDNIQIPIFLDALNDVAIDNSVRVALTLMLRLGLRSGEARGIRWIDVDFNSGVVSIEKNCGKTLAGLALTELKTKRSRRKLSLEPVLRNMLLEHKRWQREYSFALGDKWQDNDLICPNTTGGLMVNMVPHTAIKRICNARKDLPSGLHPHSLRHSFVSALIADGYDATTVADLAGDTVAVISKHYAHRLLGAPRRRYG
ncbi:MAG: site-specific integrase [Clostridiales bacterium]|jgi:integrase|nr:site-specific integrase [Clostridiales bacterium]